MTTTHLQYHIPEVWANMALGYLPNYLNLVNTVTVDLDADEISKFGDKVHVAKRGALSANDKTEGNDVTLQQPSDSEVYVTLNKHKEVTFSPSDVARAMSKPDVIKGYMDDAAQVIAEAVEDSLTDLYASAGDTVNGGNALELDDLRSARRKLILQKVPQVAPLFAYLDPYAVEDLPLTDASKLGINRPVLDGSIAQLGGFNIFESQLVATSGSPSTYHCLAYAKDAMALVVRPLATDAETFGGAKQAVITAPQSNFSIRVTMSYNANALAPQVTLDCLWGVAVLRSEH